ncbi:ABC transporter substrate-binding protein [Marinobacterium lutimaris]|uniref:NitT/TauT family transport system substrate-binding protein n=1 Tax=Marinobacterium lutimaris TaxID=568106 RepID=A0A1H5W6I3_9GAMM|nr:ABC transporter substrate-binding protein [Marinobacterium lutimaris]SEF94836.1 NitT/TauT family transport system substrate-binding protein [Marinobacterium lutimaris]
MATLFRILILLALYLPAALYAAKDAAANELPKVRVGMLQFGTAHWELAHIQQAGLDRKHGYKLELLPLANSSAGRLALTAGNVDWIVGDWVWAAERTLQGAPLRFIPFSTRIGEIMVPTDSGIASVADLRRKRIGVAGGPQGKSWQLLNAAAAKQGIDLAQAAEVSFGAPPLLSRELEAGRLDALLTFWHFAARLEASGQFKPAISAVSISESLGLDSRLPLLGYLANQQWVVENQTLASNFASSIYASKSDLREDRPWETLRPLMRVNDDASFQALRQGYRSGEPEALLSAAMLESANRAWPYLRHEKHPLPLAIFQGVSQGQGLTLYQSKAQQ